MKTWMGKLLGRLSLAAMFSFNAWATTHYVDVNGTNPVSPYTDWSTAATSIQDAINVATNSDLVLVTNGVYATGGQVVGSLTNRVVINKAVMVQSVNGPSVTIIQGYQLFGTVTGDGAVRCAYLDGSAVLSGFTLTAGATRGADGIPKLEQYGGGAYCGSDNSVISNCVLVGNTAYLGGGGARDGTIKNCIIRGNSAAYGGGTSFGRLYNCMIVSNTATATGGGALGGVLNNCTIIGNFASTCGGGFDGGSDGVLNNCIVFFNDAPTNANYNRSPFSILGSVNYTCIVPYFSNGIGSITNDPVFVDVAAGDLHLQSNSLCINAGNNACVSVTNDLDGNPRIVGGTVDIGAYEYQTPSSILSYAWAQQYGLPTDGTADNADTDTDGMNNYAEWKSSTNPTNALSLLQLASPVFTNSPAGIVVTWQSVTNVTYYLERSSDLAGAFSSLQSNLVGQAVSISYTDTTATNEGPYFYRVGVQ